MRGPFWRCGGNGEYHSLVLDGPVFKKALRIAAFDVGERDGLMYMAALDILEKRRRACELPRVKPRGIKA